MLLRAHGQRPWQTQLQCHHTRGDQNRSSPAGGCQAGSHARTLPRTYRRVTRKGFPRHRRGAHSPFVALLQKRQINIWPRLGSLASAQTEHAAASCLVDGDCVFLGRRFADHLKFKLRAGRGGTGSMGEPPGSSSNDKAKAHG